MFLRYGLKTWSKKHGLKKDKFLKKQVLKKASS